MNDLKSMTYEELTEFVLSGGFPRFRADQLYRHLARGIAAFEDIPNLPRPMIDWLRQNATLTSFQIVNKYRSALDETVKYLVKLDNEAYVECVVMDYKHGLSVCLSTQVGCRMGCAFCASTIGGRERDMTAGEIRDQYLFLSKDMGRRIDSIVLMGMGEPLDNYENVLRFIRLIHDERGVNLSTRHIALSTCGITPRIRQLAKEKLGIALAVSLHAPNDELRRQIMPVARTYPLSDLIAACVDYERQTGRRITFEYTLIKGFNDSPACAKQLITLLKPLKNRHVNLISVNPVEGRTFERCTQQDIFAFQKMLSDGQINATVRRSMGSDISGSCGQLKAQERS